MLKFFLGNMNSRTNHAYCPPDGEFGTIEAYVWNCHPGPSGAPRGKLPYYSNPNVQVDGVATGSQTENNAKYMTDNRFASASAGTNCLDGHPDDAWMMFRSDGKIGDNCLNGEQFFEPPLESTRGKFNSAMQFVRYGIHNLITIEEHLFAIIANFSNSKLRIWTLGYLGRL